MSQGISADEILDFAIKNEEDAAKFYTDLAAKMESDAIASVFEGFAREEQGHKAKLQGVKKSGKLEPSTKHVLDLKIADYVVDVKPEGKLSYQDALILAMKKAKAAFRLYTILAEIAMDENLRNVMLALAQEEAKHKLRFEIEYDDMFLKEN